MPNPREFLHPFPISREQEDGFADQGKMSSRIEEGGGMVFMLFLITVREECATGRKRVKEKVHSVMLNTCPEKLIVIMSMSSGQVCQFKITLIGITPRIWRKIQVPATSTFWDLSVAIQDVMEWGGFHLHEFTIMDPTTGVRETIGIPDEELPDQVRQGWTTRISRFFSMENRKAVYIYDFSDYWEHTVTLEKILPADPLINYPRCIGGKRRAPPEDVGGLPGFEEFMEIMQDRTHKEHDEMVEWYGGEWEPEYFSCNDIVFNDPAEMLKLMQGIII